VTETRRAQVRALRAVRVAILATAVALLIGLALLFKETPYVFTAFMVLGPLLLGIAFVIMGWVILGELRENKVL
jgi:hypothetical protein